MHILEEAGKREKNRRVDAFVQSTDKNLMVPVGGSIIAGFDADFVRKVAQNYPGRASSSPTIDVFITLMQMGTSGYKALMDDRKENYKLLKNEMVKVAEKYGERVLETKNNPISIGNNEPSFFFNALIFWTNKISPESQLPSSKRLKVQ